MPAAEYIAKASAGRHGTAVTSEERALQIAARVRELEGYEQRVAAARRSGDEKKAEEWENRVEQVREDLRAWGHEGEAPQRRASRRTRPEAETR